MHNHGGPLGFGFLKDRGGAANPGSSGHGFSRYDITAEDIARTLLDKYAEELIMARAKRDGQFMHEYNKLMHSESYKRAEQAVESVIYNELPLGSEIERMSAELPHDAPLPMIKQFVDGIVKKYDAQIRERLR